mmetsp:Transcript_15606/g.41971  ORF Transcript_15606/g.41971 Transcript_15606/m.41971 type:complete len:472 (-) Transcript_15606:253-1668(-)
MQHLHAPLAQRQQARLGANRLDVRARQLVLAHDKLLHLDVLRQRHLRGVDLENLPLRLLIRHRELDLPIDPPRPQQRGIEALDPVRREHDLHVAAAIKPVELIQQLKHRPLDLALAPRRRVVALGPDRVDLVDKDEGRGHFLRYAEELADKLGSLAEVLLDELGADDAEKSGGGAVGDGLGEECLAGARNAVEDDALGGLDADVLVDFRVREGELDGFLDFLDLRLEAADVGVGFERRFVDFHDGHHGVDLVAEDADDAEDFVVEENGGSRLELVLVHKRGDADVVLRPHRGRHNRVIVVDDFLQAADAHRGAPDLVDLRAVLLGLLLARLDHLLVRDELLLHEQKVLDALELEHPQPALGGRRDGRELGGGLGPALLLLAPDAGGRGGRFVFLLLLAFIAALAGGAALVLTHGEEGGEGRGDAGGKDERVLIAADESTSSRVDDCRGFAVLLWRAGLSLLVAIVTHFVCV